MAALAVLIFTLMAPGTAPAGRAFAAPSDPWWDTMPSPAQPPPSLQEVVCQYEWRGGCQKAMLVMHCESSGDPAAWDGYNAGLFQISVRFHSWRLRPGESLFDIGANIRIAHEIEVEQGWESPWPTCGRL